MKINSFSQIGKRSNNEDYTEYNERLWMVCDGVGGHVSGERASKFVVDRMLELFAQDDPELKKTTIEDRLIQVQKELNAVLDTEPDLEKMGTTFTGVFKTDSYWYAAHIGDSRIYLFRPSEQKLWHTWDHSLVGELMKNHDITREDGRFHPMSNRISKAIIANSDNKVQTPDIVKIDELRAGDIFLLCSDGLVEAWGDHELVELFEKTEMTFEERFQKIQEQCAQLSKDNNTALLIEMEEDDAFSFGNGKNEELKWITFQDIKDDYKEYKDKQPDLDEQSEDEPVEVISEEEGDELKPENESVESPACEVLNPSPEVPELKGGFVKYIIGVLLLLVGIAIGVYWEKNKGKGPEKTRTEQPAVQKPKKKATGNSSQTIPLKSANAKEGLKALKNQNPKTDSDSAKKE